VLYKQALIVFSLLFTCCPAFAEEPLPAHTLLQKLSLKLRGSSPSAEELAAFKEQTEREPGRFPEILAEEVQRYMASPRFRDVVENMHAVWWRLPRRETTYLAGEIVQNDRPYFEIFNKNYLLLDGATARDYIESSIGTEGPLPTVPGDWRKVRLAEDETRFRSILSGIDVLNQFPDTPTNKNRARSNYIFKTFLCETLAPTPPGEFTPWETSHEEASAFARLGDEHGTNPDCIGCHYRLDPMARFFDHWRPPLPNKVGTWFDPSQEAKGKAIIRESDGTTRAYEGTAESALALILREDPKVKRCVVNKAWEFVFGTAVKIPEETESQLVAKFESRQNFKELLAAVVQHPYFWSTEEAPPLKFEDVKAAFGSCADVMCHRPDGNTSPKFDPQAYPFRADAEANFRLVKDIWSAINHKSGYSPMPKKPRPKLPPDVLSKIKDWISAGAFDGQSNATLSETQIQEVLDE
jgi:hypothetical protein